MISAGALNLLITGVAILVWIKIFDEIVSPILEKVVIPFLEKKVAAMEAAQEKREPRKVAMAASILEEISARLPLVDPKYARLASAAVEKADGDIQELTRILDKLKSIVDANRVDKPAAPAAS